LSAVWWLLYLISNATRREAPRVGMTLGEFHIPSLPRGRKWKECEGKEQRKLNIEPPKVG